MRRPALAVAAMATTVLGVAPAAPAFADRPVRLAVAGDIAWSPSVLPMGVRPTTCQEAGTGQLAQTRAGCGGDPGRSPVRRPDPERVPRLSRADVGSVLYAAGATMIFNGYDHDYQRFARQTPDAKVDLVHGVREFVIGTGGKSLFEPGPVPGANSEICDRSTFGVGMFTLYDHSYRWHFVREPIAGNGTFTDQGSAPCNTHPRGRDGGGRGDGSAT